jgi:hypothetical protein
MVGVPLGYRGRRRKKMTRLLTAFLAALVADVGYLAHAAVHAMRVRVWLAGLPAHKRNFARAAMTIFPRYRVHFTDSYVILACYDPEWRERTLYFDSQGGVEVMSWDEVWGTRYFLVRWEDGDVYAFPDGDYPTPPWLFWTLT